MKRSTLPGLRRCSLAGRLLALLGVTIAAVGQLMLSTADPGGRPPPGSIGLLLLGTALFALAASPPGVLRQISPAGPVLRPVGAIMSSRLRLGIMLLGLAVLVVLLWRLATDSTASTDLLLWSGSLLAGAMLFVQRPTARSAVCWRSWLPELVALLLIGGAFIALNRSDLNAWYYSVIGDEYSFYTAARETLERGIVRPFSQAGVYDTHPRLNTLYQSLVMAIFGPDRVGWTTASMISVLVGLAGILALGRLLASHVVAIIAGLVFGLSHYLFAFVHVGYNSLDAIPPAVWLVALYLIGARSASPLALYLAGIAGGLGFYTFYSARMMPLVLGLFVLTQRDRWRRLAALWPLGLGLVLTIAPLVVVNKADLVLKMVAQVPGGYSSGVTGPIGERLANNVSLNLLAFNFNPSLSHYVGGSLLDPVSALAALLGLALAVAFVGYESLRLVLIWFGIAIAVTGLLSPYPNVAITRLHFCLPPLALLAGIGAQQVGRMVPLPSGSMARRVAGAIGVAGFAAAVLWLNLQRFWIETPKRSHLTQDAVAIGALRSEQCGPDQRRNIIIARATIPALRPALVSYSPTGELPRLIDHAALRPNQPLDTVGIRCVIFTEAGDPAARAVLDDLRRRYPDGVLRTFADRANKGKVSYFVLPRAG